MADSDFGMGYALGADSNGSNGNSGGMWGSDAIWAIILFAMIFGRGGWGGGFGGGSNDGLVTQADLCSQFNFNDLQGSVRGIQQGICDSTYALNNSIMSGFHGVDNAICTLGYQAQQGFSSLAAQMASCCCDIERGQDRIGAQIAECCCDLKTQMATNTRDIIDSQNCGTRAILDFLTNEKIDSLRAENQALRFSASQDRQNALLTTAMTAQTQQLIDRIAPYPIPSFNVCAPYNLGGYGYGSWGGNGGYGSRDGCGCGCGCG